MGEKRLTVAAARRQFSAMSDLTDKYLADRVLRALRTLSVGLRDVKISELNALRRELGNPSPDLRRAEVWLAMSALCQALKPDEPGDFTELYTHAVSRAEDWRNSIG
jgi:hypothetical protein